MIKKINLIEATWPAPNNVHAFTTTRHAGYSQHQHASLNIGMHCGDEVEAVEKNRQLLVSELALPHSPIWLRQTHTTHVVKATDYQHPQEADGLYTELKQQVCAVLTADCLPIFLCNRQGSEAAILHAGWRGLAGGIITSGLAHFKSPPEQMLAWLGPAIGPQQFEVGADVLNAFITQDVMNETAFTVKAPGKWLANLYELARMQLTKHGIPAIYGGDYCTYTDATQFYSYRRDGKISGRMASIIWLSS